MSKKRTRSSTTNDKVSLRTRQVHGKFHTQAWDFSHHLIPPVTASTTFRLGSLRRGAQGFLDFSQEENASRSPILIYDRLHEPNTSMLEEQLAEMEGGELALSFGSGMGAISTALIGVLKAGQKVLCHRTIYGCTYSLLTNWLARFGIYSEFIDLNSEALAEKLADGSFRVVFGESISNPNLEILDLPKITKTINAANKARPDNEKALFIVDNTFATPWSLRPLDWGADMVVHSLTKNISGFGTDMGGAIITRNEFSSVLKVARKDFGAVLTPRSAWEIFVFGIPTLALRFEKQQMNAIKIAKVLDSHPKIEQVFHPALKSFSQHKLAKKILKTPEGDFAPGFMVSFTLKGSIKRAQKFVDLLAQKSYSITLAVSLGTTKTLVEVPGHMTHSVMNEKTLKACGIDPRLIRLSVGLEHHDDLIFDLKKYLAQV